MKFSIVVYSLYDCLQWKDDNQAPYWYYLILSDLFLTIGFSNNGSEYQCKTLVIEQHLSSFEERYYAMPKTNPGIA